MSGRANKQKKNEGNSTEEDNDTGRDERKHNSQNWSIYSKSKCYLLEICAILFTSPTNDKCYGVDQFNIHQWVVMIGHVNMVYSILAHFVHSIIPFPITSRMS